MIDFYSFSLEPTPAITVSPLIYPGGKSRYASAIIRHMPLGTKRLCSPFLGGGSVEITLAQKGVDVFGYDAYEPLVNFWQHCLSDAKGLAEAASKYHPLSKEDFWDIKNDYADLTDKKQMAVIFYVVNRASFSGLTFSSGQMPMPPHSNFTKRALQRVAYFKAPKLQVRCADFAESISEHKNDFLYLDPPYAIEGILYGNKGDRHKDFDHKKLANILSKRGDWLLSYNDCLLVRELYSDCKIEKLPVRYSLTIKGGEKMKDCNELLIKPH